MDSYDESLPGVYARGSKKSHTGGKSVACRGLKEWWSVSSPPIPGASDTPSSQRGRRVETRRRTYTALKEHSPWQDEEESHDV